MDTSGRHHDKRYLRAHLDGRPVDVSSLFAAIWDGEMVDLSRVEVTLAARPYLSSEAQPVPKENAGDPPVSCGSVRKGVR